MSIDIYPPLIIINNIVNEFFPFRGFKLTKPNIINEDEIITNMENIGYIRIEGVNEKNPRKGRNIILFIIFKNNESNSIEIRKIKKIIDDIDNESITKDKQLDELFIVLNKDFFDKKNFNDINKELNNRQKNGTDLNGEFAFYTICPYYNFAFSVPKCTILFPHIILPKEEIDNLLQTERISVKDLQVILSNDVNIIWNGGRIGDIIKIIRNSEASLYSICYRRVERILR